MPERWGNVPGIDRNSQDPKVGAASLLLSLPSDSSVSIASTYQPVNALLGRVRGRYSKAGNWDQQFKVISYEGLSLTLDVMTTIDAQDQRDGH